MYLQLQALVQHHAALHPGFLKVGPLLLQGLQPLLDVTASIVASHKQLLAKLLEGLEGSGASVDLCTVLLREGEMHVMSCPNNFCGYLLADTPTQGVATRWRLGQWQQGQSFSYKVFFV